MLNLPSSARHGSTLFRKRVGDVRSSAMERSYAIRQLASLRRHESFVVVPMMVRLMTGKCQRED